MLIGRVTGTLVASQKDPGLEGFKLLILRQLDPRPPLRCRRHGHHRQLGSRRKTAVSQDFPRRAVGQLNPI